MEILCFKIRGKLAHFRKYYANNTAFSFTIPPRTSLMGMVAAAMGWPRDSYYEKLSSEHIRFGIRVISPLKKSFHRLNFLSIKSLGDMSKNWTSDFRGVNGRIQTPFEIVSGANIATEEVQYQVFISTNDSGLQTYHEIRNHFLESKPVFNITLGVANFTASIFDIEVVPDDHIKKKTEDDFILINSAVNSHEVDELKFDKDEYENYSFVEEDMMPGDFVENGNREVKKMNRLLFSTTPNPLRVKLNTHYYVLQLKDDVIRIQFIN